MNSILVNFKREYWENKRLILGFPVGLSVFFIIVGIIATLAFTSSDEYQVYKDARVDISIANEQIIDIMEGAEAIEGSHGVELDNLREHENRWNENVNHGARKAAETSALGLMGFYIGVAWLAGLIYLLSSLYSDRKDSSILFWKSLPISETQNVLTKYVFGTLGFSAAFVVVGWVTYLFYFILGLGMTFNSGIGQYSGNIFDYLSVSKLIVLPIMVIIVSFFWSAPIFAYAIAVSAVSKRTPVLLLLVPPIALAIGEGILFRSANFISTVAKYLPFNTLKDIAFVNSYTEFFTKYFVENIGEMFLGWVVAAAFIYLAVWYRNNRFEM